MFPRQLEPLVSCNSIPEMENSFTSIRMLMRMRMGMRNGIGIGMGVCMDMRAGRWTRGA